jgi:LDH2 family malate/lactate/ureidoglycolate dehydrogenase
MMAINVGRLTDIDEFKVRVDALFQSMKESALAPGHEEILIPGDPERRMREKRIVEGIYIEDKTWGDIMELATGLGVSVPSSGGS